MSKKKIDISKLSAASEGAAMTDNVDQLKEQSTVSATKPAAGKGGRKKVDPAKKLSPIATLNGTPDEKEKMEDWAQKNGFTSLSQVLRVLCAKEGII
jgi:hypothetical protein